MKEERYCLIAFESTHHAIKGEKLLLNENIKVRTIPTPRDITASCGLSIKFSEEKLNEVIKIMEESKLKLKGIYMVTKSNNKNLIDNIM